MILSQRLLFSFLLALLCLRSEPMLLGQCPQLQSNATLNSPDCVNGNTPCDVCPDDVITLTATGTGLLPGSCVEWYYGTTNNFNPYNGQGTYIGCSMVEEVPPSSCDDCPLTLGLFVDACGVEENNEFMVIWSGSGFYVDDAGLDFDASVNSGGGNEDIGAGCSWQEPTPSAIASIQTICPGAVVVGAGPGDAVPPGVLVMVFTSAGYDFGYNFGSLCPLAPTIYVMQNGCTRTDDAFANSGGSQSTTFTLSCGCSDNTTYNAGNLLGGNGAFVTDAGFPPFYGNAGCGFPPFPGIPGNSPPPIQVLPLDFTISADMCNGGPYYAVGIADPLPAGCAQTFTNYLAFDVPCSTPVLGTGNVCENAGLVDLSQYEDPAMPPGSWSGPGVSGSSFDPSGLSGQIDLAFTPVSTCWQATNTALDVKEAPGSSITPPPDVCPDQPFILEVNMSGEGPWAFDLYEGGSYLSSHVTQDNPFYIDVVLSASSFYSIENLMDANCDGPASSVNVSVLNNPVAELVLLGAGTVCAGEEVDFQVDFQAGDPPYTFYYSLNGMQQPPVTTSSAPYDFSLTFTDTTVIVLDSVSANGCPGSVIGSFTIHTLTPPTAVLTGGGQICQNGNGTNLTVTFTGDAPFTFVYSANNVNQPPITTSQNPFTIAVNPPSGTTYRLVSVNSGGCAGTVSGIASVFVFTPSTATIGGDYYFCNQADTSISVNFTGTGPFNLVYAINGVMQDSIDTFDDPFLLPVLTDTNQVYSLISVESPGCIGTVNGVANIFVNYPPDYINLNLNCSPAQNNYTVSFEVTGATPPLSLLAGSGAFTGNQFVSDPIHQDSAYFIIFTDSLACGNITVAGASTCNCVSEAGTMDSVLLSICPGDTAQAAYLGGFTGDANDSLRFILHTNPQFPPGQIIAWNNLPAFSFLPGMATDSVYYISAVAGNYSGADTIDLADPCLSIAKGTPVIFREAPAAQLSADTTLCNGALFNAGLFLSGAPPYSVIYRLNGIAQPPIVTISDTTFIPIILSGATTISLQSITDAHCSAGLSDTLLVQALDAPTIDSVRSQCDLLNGTYVLEVFISGGEPPYTLTGVAGAFNGTVFVSDPQASGQSYQIFVSDDNLCGIDSTSGSVNCNCFTQAGTVDQTPINLCAGESAVITANNDQMLDADDLLMFVLHTLPGATLGTVLDISMNPTFGFIPVAMTEGVTYYVSAIAGTNDGTGQIDLSDPCLSISPGTPVVWKPAPTAVIGGTYDICRGQTVSFAVQFTGEPIYSLTYQVNGQNSSILAPQNNFQISTTLQQSALIQLVSVSDANCPGSVSGAVNITVHPTPAVGPPVITCTPDNLSYTVGFQVTQGDIPTIGITGNPGAYDPAAGSFLSDPIPAGSAYQFIVSDVWACGADTLAGTHTCVCVTDAGQMTPASINLCEGDSILLAPATGQATDGNDVVQYILYQSNGTLPQNILASRDLPEFPYLPGLMAGSTYFVSAVAGNDDGSGNVDFNDPCLSVSPPVSVTVRAVPTAIIAGDTTICQGNNYNFPVVFTGNGPFTLVYQVNNNAPQTIIAPQNQFSISTNNVQQTQVFQLVSVQGAFCPGTVNGTVTIDVQPPPAVLAPDDSRICPGESILLPFLVVNADSVLMNIYSPNDTIQVSGPAPSFSASFGPAATTEYQIGSLQFFGNTCNFQLPPPFTVSLNPPSLDIIASDYNGYGVRCFGATDGVLFAEVSGGFAPTGIVWSTGQTGDTLSNLSGGVYEATLTDAEGCTATASATLTVPDDLFFAVDINDPTCTQAGALVLLDVRGGVGPFSWQLPGVTGTVGALPLEIGPLQEGTYTLEVVDANDCMATDSFTLVSPTPFTVDLGPDLSIFPGDTLLLTPLVTTADIQVVSWTPITDLGTPGQINTAAYPTNTTVYTLMITDSKGCSASDDIVVSVKKERNVFIPNVFRPETGLGNDYFSVYAGPGVAALNRMEIYDRWGSLVFAASDLPVNSPGTGWDGFISGKAAAPGVYIYVIEIRYDSGETEVKSGDVTVFR